MKINILIIRTIQIMIVSFICRMSYSNETSIILAVLSAIMFCLIDIQKELSKGE